MARQGGSLNAVKAIGANRAVVFLHGFTGKRDDTWDQFPTLLGQSVDRDIYTLGYATTFLPDIVGVWSADPDLPIVAAMLRSEFKIQPLDQYKSLTLVAHSMGGLVAQKALVDEPELSEKVDHLILFGTPSGGLKKASWLTFWKRQLRNMARGSEFITALRQRWADNFGLIPKFDLRVVAGTKDQFVPPESSLEPFDPSLHYVVPGDHLSIVKPDDTDSASLRLLASTLGGPIGAPEETRAPLVLAAETPSADTPQLIEARGDGMSEAEVVEAALALERGGDRDSSIALLERYQALGTDVQGTLAGRMKRIWLETELLATAERAYVLYKAALKHAEEEGDSGQIYYHAINVAFLALAAFDRPDEARKMAELALKHCELTGDDDKYWNVATQAEAYLYLGEPEKALEGYRTARSMEVEQWKFASTSLQAGQIASVLNNEQLGEKLEAIFTPGARRVNKIFLSYSHKDEDWKNQLVTTLQPYLRQAEAELDLWVDSEKIAAGDQWFERIQQGLSEAGVAVALVSPDFLASDFVIEHELPVIIEAAEEGDLRLVWVYLSAAAYDATPLKKFQAAHDPGKPLDSLPKSERRQALLDVAREIKAAALSATERFRGD